MHQHVYTGGSSRSDDDIIHRYCLCGVAYIYSTRTKRSWSIFQDDEMYYHDMAKRLLEK